MFNYVPPGNVASRESSASEVIMISKQVDGSSNKRKRSQSHKRKTEEGVQGVNREIIYFYCGNKGHLAPDCLVKKKAIRKHTRGGNINEDSSYSDEHCFTCLRLQTHQKLLLLQMFPPQIIFRRIVYS